MVRMCFQVEDMDGSEVENGIDVLSAVLSSLTFYNVGRSLLEASITVIENTAQFLTTDLICVPVKRLAFAQPNYNRRVIGSFTSYSSDVTDSIQLQDVDS